MSSLMETRWMKEADFEHSLRNSSDLQASSRLRLSTRAQRLVSSFSNPKSQGESRRAAAVKAPRPIRQGRLGGIREVGLEPVLVLAGQVSSKKRPRAQSCSTRASRSRGFALPDCDCRLPDFGIQSSVDSWKTAREPETVRDPGSHDTM